MTYIGFPILSLIYILFFLLLYFSKKRINLFENKVVVLLMVVNIIGLILELGCYSVLAFFKIQNTFLGMLILKSYVYYIYVFDWLFSGYIYIITSNNSDKSKMFKRALFMFSPIVILGIIITLFTKLNYYNISPKYYTYGKSIDLLVYITVIVLLPFWIFKCLKLINSKNNREKTAKIGIILFGIIIVGIAGAVMQFFDRSILIMTSAHSLMLSLIYFTIENPDMKMLKELEKSNELLETEMEEKSNLMFKISQDVRIPLNSIEELSSKMINEKSVKTLVNDSKIINSETKGVSFIVNNLLDISNMNINNIKLYKTKINIDKLVKEISLMYNDYDFKYSILNTIPEVYLDNVRLKQIIVSLINYSYKNKSTNCYLEISGIIRYDICRLLITITSNNKLDIKYINEIMNSSCDDISTNDLDLDLVSVKSLVNMLNGNFNIKSNETTTYSIIIDTELVNKTIKHNIKDKKILIIDDDKDELNKYRDIFKNFDISVNTTMFLNDIENRIDNINDFDLIIIDDEMQPYNAVKIKEYKEKNNITSNLIIMLGINKEFIKDKYLNDYKFDDYILKRNYINEIKRIVDKYL